MQEFSFMVAARIEEKIYLNVTYIGLMRASWVAVRSEEKLNQSKMVRRFAKSMREILSRERITLEIEQ